jgi:hypothetical protein
MPYAADKLSPNTKMVWAGCVLFFAATLGKCHVNTAKKHATKVMRKRPTRVYGLRVFANKCIWLTLKKSLNR